MQREDEATFRTRLVRFIQEMDDTGRPPRLLQIVEEFPAEKDRLIEALVGMEELGVLKTITHATINTPTYIRGAEALSHS